MTSASYRVQVLIQLLEQHLIKHVIFSPGSRNAPLVIGFNSSSFFDKKVVVDERSAGFYALGIAQQTKLPAVICSTSGSATLNYAPSIAEAYYQKVPLIVITADRPPEWIDHGEGQSMRQQNIYSNYIEKSYQLPMLDHPDALWQTGVIINEAIQTAKTTSKPVHLNFPFREPLYKTVPQAEKEVRKIEYVSTCKEISNDQLQILLKKWNKFQKKMIVCGSLNPDDELNNIIYKLHQGQDVCILSESTSNIYGDHIISCIDRTLERIYGRPEFLPELVITIGNSIISKKLKTLFREYNPIEHWHIEDTDRAQDVFSSLTAFLPLEPKNFLKQLTSHLENKKKENVFQNLWKKEDLMAAQNHTVFEKSCIWSDLKAHYILQKYLKDNFIIQMGNSASVRYIQLFDTKKNLNYFGNRGVSGIEGSTSTAIGSASVHSKTNILITGDLSFIYDQNGLWNNHIPNNLKLFVFNNQGGGIFKIISGPKNTPFLEQYFETKHELSLKNIAHTHHLNYHCAKNEKEAEQIIPTVLNSNQFEIVEFFTGNVENEKILNDYFSVIKK
jgi:2-succinyl-5-enolpyruvyl-6-hydroxy-3-cyclohexene-1-carboxylate synthase